MSRLYGISEEQLEMALEPKANAKHQQILVAPMKLIREDLFFLV